MPTPAHQRKAAMDPTGRLRATWFVTDLGAKMSSVLGFPGISSSLLVLPVSESREVTVKGRVLSLIVRDVVSGIEGPPEKICDCAVL